VPELAVIGNLARDHVAGETRVGGGPFHAANGLRLLPVRAVVLTKAADRSLLPPLVALGIPVRFHEASATSEFSFSYEGDVRTMTVDSLGEPFTPEEARGWMAAALGKTQWLHVSALARSDFPAETLAVLARGRRILLDGQGLTRPERTGPLVLDGAYDPEVLRHVTVLKLAEEEAAAVVPDLSEASLRKLGVPEVLVTFGSRGSLLLADGKLERIVARRVDADATGAGDAFCAAYVAGRAGGYAPAAAARRATNLVQSLLQRRR
jgi:sugar/nucleoside kinase (ribokinase family)